MTTLTEPSTDHTPVERPQPDGERPLRPPVRRDGVLLTVISLALAAGVVASMWWIGLNPVQLWQERQDVFNLLDRMWPPRIEEPSLVWDAAIETFLMAFAGTALGVILAIPVSIAAASNMVRNPVVRGAARGIIVVTRALPELVLALIFVRVYSIGVLPGVVAIGLHSVGMLGKLFADSIEQIDPGPRE
ncbi:MAG: ABC transporter permease subunit, partial [Actinomycetota bacterium]